MLLHLLLYPRPCTFVACNMKFAQKAWSILSHQVLQVTNVQGLGTRLLLYCVFILCRVWISIHVINYTNQTNWFIVTVAHGNIHLCL